MMVILLGPTINVTPQSRVLLEKQNSPPLYRTQRFIIMSTRNPTCPYPEPDESNQHLTLFP